MLKYDYKCRDCQKDFHIVADINDKRLNVKCSYCQSNNVFRIFNVVILKSENIKNNIQDKKVDKLKIDHSHGGQCSPEDDYT